MELIHLTKSEFLEKVADYHENNGDWIFKGKRPCIIDFYASWCGPCKMVAPILEELADEYKDRIDIYKVDTEKEEELSEDFQIRTIPTLLFCPMEGFPQVARGAIGKEDLKKAIESVLL
ncbi:MAG: thioredoxin [Tannerellaceae bacterium]|nr:thioredoxin [Tannerellaceae bacterium]